MSNSARQEATIPETLINEIMDVSPHAKNIVAVNSSAINNSIKRIFDVIASLMIIVVLSPVLLLLAMAVRLDGGPVLFGHRRIGINGEQFGCLKYRTMAVNAEQALAAYLVTNPQAAMEWAERRKLQHDPRVTRLGTILRKTSLDELPQLLNVLRGDMSLIGPRPVVLEELDHHYCSAGRIAYQTVRPGITGLWQVSGRSDTSYTERVRLDIVYVESWSLRLDFVILLRTIPAVFARRGAV